MAVGRYVVGDPATKKIVGGPYRWDPVAAPAWTPPESGTLLTEAAAISGGYTWPAATPDNAEVLRGKAGQALAINTAFLALPTPTNAQVVTQVQRLTRQMNALIRLTLAQLDDISDT